MRDTELIECIREAFCGVQLEDGVSLNMAEYYDSGGSATRFARAALLDERFDWQAIPEETLESFRVTFCFTDLKGFRFYLPAYMIWTIKNHRTSDCIIGDFTIYALDPNSFQFEKTPFLDWFTDRQVAVIVDFLKFCSDTDGYADERVAAQNLQKIEDRLRQRANDGLTNGRD